MLTPVSANQLTAASLAAGLVGAACFTFGTWAWGVAGALLYVLCYVLDNCDGEVARLKNQSSPAGAAFDDLVDSVADAAFFTALGFGTQQATGEALWLWLGLAASAGAAIDYVVDLVRANRFKPLATGAADADGAALPEARATLGAKLIYYLHTLSRADFCFIVLGLALFGVTWVLLPVAAVGAQVYWITDLIRKRT